MTDEEAAIVKELCDKIQNAVAWDQYSPNVVLTALAITTGAVLKANVKPEHISMATRIQMKNIREVIKSSSAYLR